MATFVFGLACGICRASTHHVGILACQTSFMYLMNAVAFGWVFDIMSSCTRVQSTRSSSTSHHFLYMISLSIWRSMVCSLTLVIFSIVFSIHAFLTCYKHNFFWHHATPCCACTTQHKKKWNGRQKLKNCFLTLKICYLTQKIGCITLKDYCLILKNINVSMKNKHNWAYLNLLIFAWTLSTILTNEFQSELMLWTLWCKAKGRGQRSCSRVYEMIKKSTCIAFLQSSKTITV